VYLLTGNLNVLSFGHIDKTWKGEWTSSGWTIPIRPFHLVCKGHVDIVPPKWANSLCGWHSYSSLP